MNEIYKKLFMWIKIMQIKINSCKFERNENRLIFSKLFLKKFREKLSYCQKYFESNFKKIKKYNQISLCYSEYRIKFQVLRNI